MRGKGRMKVSRNSKTKLDDQINVTLHVVPENFDVKCAVTTADGPNSDSSLEKRKKEEAKQPLYLKRV